MRGNRKHTASQAAEQLATTPKAEVPTATRLAVLAAALELRPQTSLSTMAQLVDNAANFVAGGYYHAAEGCLSALFARSECADLVTQLEGGLAA